MSLQVPSTKPTQTDQNSNNLICIPKIIQQTEMKKAYMYTTCITVAKTEEEEKEILKINFTNNRTSEEKKYMHALKCLL